MLSAVPPASLLVCEPSIHPRAPGLALWWHRVRVGGPVSKAAAPNVLGKEAPAHSHSRAGPRALSVPGQGPALSSARVKVSLKHFSWLQPEQRSPSISKIIA